VMPNRERKVLNLLALNSSMAILKLLPMISKILRMVIQT